MQLAGLTDKQADEIFYGLVHGDTQRADLVAKFGESCVAEAERHPVIRAALAATREP